MFSEDAGLQEDELSDELRQTLLKSKEDKKAGRVRKYEDVARECGLRGESSNTPKVCVNCPISGECNEKDVDEKTEDDEYDPEKVAEKILMRKKDVDEKDKTYCIWTTCKRFETDCPHRTYFCVREKMTKTQFQAKYPEYKFCEDYEEEGCTLQGTAVCYQNEYACSTCVINKGARLDASCNDEGPKKVVSSFPNSRPDEVQREEAESSSTKKETSV